MKEVFAADGLPIHVGDVVTRRDDKINDRYYASRLKRGTVEKVGPHVITVSFEEAEPEFSIISNTRFGCIPSDLIHLEARMNLPVFDADQFRVMLGV